MGVAGPDAEPVAYEELRATRRGGTGRDAPEGPDASARAASATELVRAMHERNAPRRAAVLRHVAALRRLADRLREAAG